jgi:hypothetical protein
MKELVQFLAAIGGVVLMAAMLWEAFETVVLPRRVTRRFRVTRMYYRTCWGLWARVVRAAVPRRWQTTWLSVFGPLSILVLLGMWAGGLIVAFALLHWSADSALVSVDKDQGFLRDLYMSGTTFFTLGLGDVVPRSAIARCLVVLEAGMGFGFLALVIAYLPALNQFFARREAGISLLDARAGSPPTAAELLRRHQYDGGVEALREFLAQWERWAAEFLEGHLSYPVLAYFRSQHDNQSWLGALTAILDTCALIRVGPPGPCMRQAELTFAMARHAVLDLCVVFKTKPRPPGHDRLGPESLALLRNALAEAGIELGDGQTEALREIRESYEPYLEALAALFRVGIPPLVPAERRPDNWQGHIRPQRKRTQGEHF